MTAREERMINNTIEELVIDIASKHDITVVKKNGDLLVAEEDFDKLTNALDLYLKDHKI